ncbi:MAG TPA: ABC transporter permease [Thermosynergistes sp.]|nr:ABC transporter permease [Thermosynergistes sp.]
MSFAALAIRNFKETFRDPLSMGFEVGLPPVFMVMFWSLGKNMGADIFTATMLLPAAVIFGFVCLTMFSAITLAGDRQSALLSRLLTTPLRSSDFILAYTLPYILIAILQIAVCFAVGALLGLEVYGNIGLVLLILLFMTICCIGLGMALGSLFTENQVSGIGSAIIVFTSLFGGLWMDLEAIGGVFQDIGYALPFAHAVDAARSVFMGAGLSDIATDLGWVLTYTVAFFILGILCFRWRTKE